jgi:hypothetical protein
MSTRRFKAMCLFAALAGCSPEAAPYRNPLDRLGMELDRIGWVDFRPCSYSTRSDGFVAVHSVATESCYVLEPPERMRGVWLPELEGSAFHPGATAAPAYRDLQRWMDGDCTWLEVDWTEVDPLLPAPIRPGTESPESFPAPSAYFIEFIGRRSSYPANYGGGCIRLVLLDRLISARAVPPPPPTGRAELRKFLLHWGAERDRRKERQRPKTALRRWLLPCPVFICRRPPGPDPGKLPALE